MRNVMKAATLESKFPILSVEHDCIISKDADITVCYRVELPELFTVTQAEYEAIHSAWAKAVKVLPNYSIVHKQDFFIEESYTPELQKEDLSFLSRSFERHFNERPYLKHTCYLFLTKTTKEHSRTTSSFNALTRGFIIPKEMQDKEAVSRFLEWLWIVKIIQKYIFLLPIATQKQVFLLVHQLQLLKHPILSIYT